MDDREPRPTPRGCKRFRHRRHECHVVLEQPPSPAADERIQDQRFHLLTLSARSDSGLRAQLAALRSHLGEHPSVPLADVAFTLQAGRRQHAWRTFVVADSREGLLDALADTARIKVRCHADGRKRTSVVLMFPGQGTQYAGMALGLLGSAACFTDVFERCRSLVLRYASFDILDALQEEADSDTLLPTRIAQPTLFAVEYALAMQLLDVGVRPDAMIGHSLGELVAACVAGVFELDDAVRLVCERARLMQAARPGAMLAVNAGQDRLVSLPATSHLAVAAMNGPESVVYSGESTAIAALESALEAADIGCRRLKTSHAFHSPMMEDAAEGLRAVVADIALRSPTLRFVSNVTGKFIESAQACDSEYWVRHLLEPVRFSQGIDTIMDALQDADKELVFVEVGPGGGLSTLIRRHPGTASTLVVSPMRRLQEHGSDAAYWLKALGTLWSAGCDPDWARLRGTGKVRRVPLPTSQFERKRHWIERPTAAQRNAHPSAPGTSGGFYLPAWELAPAASSPVVQRASSSWLILSENRGIGAALTKRVHEAGSTVECFEWATRHGDAAVDALMARLDDQAALSVVCLWPLACDEVTGGDAAGRFDAIQQRTLYPLRALLASIMERFPQRQLRVIVVTDRVFRVTAQESLQPAYATLRGLCKVVAQENPQIACRLIDVDISDDQPGDVRAELAGRIWREIDRGDVPEVALRGSGRWLRHYVPLAGSRIATARSRIRKGGHYLITGGLGRMGMHVARWLCEIHGASVTLVGRRDFPLPSEWERGRDSFAPAVASQVDWLLALQAQGACVGVRRADVADRHALEAAIVEAEREFGDIDGVFHAAGNVADSVVPFSQTTEVTFGEQFASKVIGLMHLEDIVRTRDIGFCVVMSSLAAELGGLGFTAYAAASAYADAFVQSMRNAGDDRWCSIDWDGWNFSATAEVASGSGHSMSPEEGIRALATAMTHIDQPLIVHSSSDLDARFARWVSMTDRTNAGVAASPSPASSFGFVPAETATEIAVADMWQQMLGIERIGTNDNFFELGGDSLVATRLVAKIRAYFDIRDSVLSLADFFAHPTVFHIASRIDRLSVAVKLATRQSQLREADVVEEGEF